MKSILHRLRSLFTNNVVLNNLVIWLRLESRLAPLRHRYKNHKVNKSQSLQEIAGFSVRPEINEYLEKSHSDLREVRKNYLPLHAKVFEIGCGPGLYLKDFDTKTTQLFAIDITEDMIDLAKKDNPTCTFYKGNFLTTPIDQKFNLIYTVGVLMYFPRMDLKNVFKKMYDLLEPGGIIYINYPNAISFYDLLYPDLTYIQYSPALVERLASHYFKVISHKHSFDERPANRYDKTPYKSENPLRKTTCKNAYLLIAQKPML